MDASMRTCARDPAMSNGARTWSNGMDAFSRSKSGAWVGREAASPGLPGAARLCRRLAHKQTLAPARPDLHRQSPQLDEALAPTRG